MGAPLFLLEVVSGPHQGATVPLVDGAELVIGRESDLDVVIQDELVSRKHARVSVAGGEAVLQDLGSTNGTFVNGQRVKRARLAPGDRVVIGPSTMRVVDPAAAPSPPAGPPPLPREARRPAAMAGRVEEVPLPDLLQLLAASRKTGTMVIAGPRGEARLHVKDGRLVGCAIAGAPGLRSRKAFARLLGWTEGAFELRQAEAMDAEATLDAPMEGLLLDGLREVDELRALADRLPPAATPLAVAIPLGAPLRALGPEELDVVQRVLEAGGAATVAALLDAAAEGDAAIAARVIGLVEKGVLVVAG